MASATNLGVKYWQGTRAMYTDWQVRSSVTKTPIAGYQGSYNYVVAFRFTIAAPARSVTIKNRTSSGVNGTMGSEASLRYKIVTAEDSSLINATASTAADGTATTSGNSNNTLCTITLTKSLAAGTYIVYLWTNKAAGTPNYVGFYFGLYDPDESTCGLSVEYEEGGAYVHIDSGSGWADYEVYIDNGSSWDRYEPYIDNGSGWDEYGG